MLLVLSLVLNPLVLVLVLVLLPLLLRLRLPVLRLRLRLLLRLPVHGIAPTWKSGDGKERNKRGMIVTSCGIAGCMYESPCTRTMLLHKAKKHGVYKENGKDLILDDLHNSKRKFEETSGIANVPEGQLDEAAVVSHTNFINNFERKVAQHLKTTKVAAA